MHAGTGLKAEHYQTVLDHSPEVGFFEVHAENFMGAGGPPHRYLKAIRERYPLSIHGVGLSLGSSKDLDQQHLRRLKELLGRYEPRFFSEHLAWSTHDGYSLNDLLPLPYNPQTLEQVCMHIDEAQAFLGRKLLLENPSTYVEFRASTMTEEMFLAEIVTRTGCGLLLDVNNVYVSATNQGRDPSTCLASLPLDQVEEIHLAGFAERNDETGTSLLIDNHGSAVHPAVWNLYAEVIRRTGSLPTLIEWDNQVPAWATLYAEARKAEAILLGMNAVPARQETPRVVGSR